MNENRFRQADADKANEEYIHPRRCTQSIFMQTDADKADEEQIQAYKCRHKKIKSRFGQMQTKQNQTHNQNVRPNRIRYRTGQIQLK
ncbi:hypothetical protein Tco_1035997 [Tanacetum coccineum]